MNTETSSQEIAPTENLLVVDHKGRVLSRRVSQVYGRALLGAMALRVPSLPSMQLHGSFLQQNEPFTLNKVRKAVRTVAPRDNLIFIEDGGKILSCQINFDYGRALLESLQHTSEDASETRAVLSRATFTRANETGNHGGNMMTHSSGHASEEMHQHHPSTSSPSLGTSTPSAKNLGILSDQILSSANRHPYDRDWINRHCIKEDCLDGSLSKHKVDVLIRHGAIRVGDRLCVTYHPDSGPVVKAGEVGFRSGPLVVMKLIFHHSRSCKVRNKAVWIYALHPPAKTSMASCMTVKPPKISSTGWIRSSKWNATPSPGRRGSRSVWWLGMVRKWEVCGRFDMRIRSLRTGWRSGVLGIEGRAHEYLCSSFVVRSNIVALNATDQSQVPLYLRLQDLQMTLVLYSRPEVMPK